MNKPRMLYRDNMNGLTKPAYQRIGHQAGVKSMNGLMYEELRGVVKEHLGEIIKLAVTYTENDNRKTVSLNDVLRAIEDQGDKLAFSHAMAKAAKTCKK